MGQLPNGHLASLFSFRPMAGNEWPRCSFQLKIVLVVHNYSIFFFICTVFELILDDNTNICELNTANTLGLQITFYCHGLVSSEQPTLLHAWQRCIHLLQY